MPCIFSGHFKFYMLMYVPKVFEVQSGIFRDCFHSTVLYAQFDAWDWTFDIRCFFAAIQRKQDSLP